MRRLFRALFQPVPEIRPSSRRQKSAGKIDFASRVFGSELPKGMRQYRFRAKTCSWIGRISTSRRHTCFALNRVPRPSDACGRLGQLLEHRVGAARFGVVSARAFAAAEPRELQMEKFIGAMSRLFVYDRGAVGWLARERAVRRGRRDNAIPGQANRPYDAGK